MKWVWLVSGLLVLAVLAALFVGSRLPVRHTATRAAVLSGTPETVFAVLTDYASAPSWRRDLKSVEILPSEDGAIRFREDGSNGRILFEVVEAVPSRRLTVRIADDKLPFGGSWTYELTPSDGGTRLSITENGEIYSPLFRVMSRYVFGYHKTLDAYLRSLGDKLGEPAEGAP